jgi:uncharacterized protein YqhQ
LTLEKPAVALQQVSVGGQAVVEGVMMRAPGATSVAVRRPDGSLAVRVKIAQRIASRYPILARPGLRGVAMLLETMVDGMSALAFAADQAMPEEERPTGAITPVALALTLAFSMAFGFFLFAVVPHILTWAFGLAVGSDALSGGRAMSFHLLDGVVKFCIFIGFVWMMSRMKDMRRVFEYHGAEHQAVHAFEHRLPLTVGSLASFPTAHPRCGTAFMVTVIAVSILVFAVIFPFIPEVSGIRILNQAAFVAIKLPLVLPVAGLSYELIRYAGKKQDGLFGRILSAPGVWMQAITTQKPDASQQEVAIVALDAALAPEAFGVTALNPQKTVFFRDIAEFEASLVVAGGEGAP